ncbi:hypothetical protein D3C81_1758770 [compost metagenome]
MPIDDRQLKLRGRIDEDVHVHVVVALIKTADGRIDPGGGQGRDVIRQAEIQITHQAPGQVLCLVAKCIYRAEQR